MKKRLLLAGLICISTLSFATFTSCNSDNGSIDKTPPSNKTYVKEEPYTLGQLEGASEIKTATYKMPNVLELQAEATALVFYPKTARPADGWRTVVWAHGTVGVGDACAPSKNELGANFSILAESLLNEGYVIIAPDYEGLGTPGIHPYLHLESEANSAIYAVKAVHEKYETEFNPDWMSVGQSQGGQASLGIAEYANNNPNFKGAVAGAPASSLGKIILEVAPLALAQIEAQEDAANIPHENRTSINSYATLLSYAGLAGAGIKAYQTDFDYIKLFMSRSQAFAPLAEGNNGECLDEIRQAFKGDIIAFMKEDKTHKIMDYPGLDENTFKKDPIVQDFLKRSQPGTKKIDKPVLVIQGTKDTNVPYPVTEEMVKNLQNLGSENITFLPVVGASHTEAIVQANPQLVKFIKQYLPAK
ncbi:alpha/beta hydrolase family protein [Myroides pelagicus]|uniref:Prolyl oligopeptidase family serine peptidase n=1 Tax=Myroides pelagicus TaxID=270914 RepID=A0A7K1GMK5_9FLAO|nr:alpha/beta hydrolase [Myroides pelagicus]MTH29970.1 prolyl oligopeptidase family serine peptidase [Myroides pelagicus]